MIAGATTAPERASWLAVVATPIGNLEDLSPRAARILAEADVVLAEDTRRARALLSHLGITGKRVVRLDSHVERDAASRWVEQLREGARIALVSDAGTPAISDPGSALVRAAIERGVLIVPVPGPNAVITALAASGFPADRFRFFGFLPRKTSARRAICTEIAGTEETVVLFEAPQRAEQTLAELSELMPDRQAVVARELTKLHEELVRGALSEVARPRHWRGEITIVLGPHRAPDAETAPVDVDARIDELLAQGLRGKDAAKQLAEELRLSAREIYARIVQRQRHGG
jgi:16S rRNA (cytidine1402-2'-O)-methyltransferase